MRNITRYCEMLQDIANMIQIGIGIEFLLQNRYNTSAMNSYYLTLVLKPELEEKERVALLDQIKKRVLADDGKLDKEDIWGSRDLNYSIKRNSKGYYVHYQVTTNPANMKGIDKVLKVEEDILRYLVVKR